jgi:hypothetical protein
MVGTWNDRRLLPNAWTVSCYERNSAIVSRFCPFLGRCIKKNLLDNPCQRPPSQKNIPKVQGKSKKILKRFWTLGLKNQITPPRLLIHALQYFRTGVKCSSYNLSQAINDKTRTWSPKLYWRNNSYVFFADNLGLFYFAETTVFHEFSTG